MADVPPGRVEALARAGLTGDAFTLRRLPAVRRAATLLATARTLRSNAIDDALDLFAVLMASKLIGPAERASVAERLRSLPQLAKASATLAIAARVLLEFAEPGEADSGQILDPAVATVEEFVPDDGDDAASGQRQELLKRYATVRPFLSMLSAVVPMASTDLGRPVLLAVQGLADLRGRKRLNRGDIIDAVGTGSWRQLVFTSEPVVSRHGGCGRMGGGPLLTVRMIGKGGARFDSVGLRRQCAERLVRGNGPPAPAVLGEVVDGLPGTEDVAVPEEPLQTYQRPRGLV